jgi:hypothetical protein
MREVQVEIQPNFTQAAQELVIFYEEDGKVYLAKPMQLVFEPVNQYARWEPTLVLPGPTLARTLLKALAEACDRHGVKTESDAKIEGKLQATEAHLRFAVRIVEKTLQLPPAPPHHE